MHESSCVPHLRRQDCVPHICITVIAIGASFPIQIMNVILMCMQREFVHTSS